MSGFNTQPPEGGWISGTEKSSFLVEFQHTAARRRLAAGLGHTNSRGMFQHTAARRRLGQPIYFQLTAYAPFQHTAARRRLGKEQRVPRCAKLFQHTAARRRLAKHQNRTHRPNQRFNTQPPEGGWWLRLWAYRLLLSFNTQPPEGGWVLLCVRLSRMGGFNTQPPEGGWLL